MTQKHLRHVVGRLVALLPMVGPGSAWAGDFFTPDHLVLTRSVYQGTSSTVTVNQTLPPGCVTGNVNVPKITTGSFIVAVTCAMASNDGTYPNVFLNDGLDSSFGVTSPIYLDQLTTGGATVNSLTIDSSQIVTSFSSKSELGVHNSLDGNSITFMGYVGGPGFVTGPNQLDVSNSNTPGVIDPTNPVVSQYYRSIAEVDVLGKLTITNNNAYSGNNGREAIKAGVGTYYTAGNNNNGGLSKTQIPLTFVGQNLIHSTGLEYVNSVGAPYPAGNIPMVGNYLIAGDKPGKDTNFRGLTIYNDTLYFTKGSGGNGINTVYTVGTPGTLPTPANSGGVSGLFNLPISIVPGFPTIPASDPTARFPFDIWFANPTTMYVADEGDGNPADAATDAKSGLQKWTYNGTDWNLAYTLQAGLNLGVPYSVPTPSGATPYPNPSPDGLRHIIGRVNTDGTASIWATTSTVSASGDQGADPNQLVYITDNVAAATLPANESFTLLKTAGYGEVLRGVSWAPGNAAGVPASGTACNGVYNGAFTGNMVISAGQNCVFTGGSITGNIELAGGTLTLSNVTVSGNLATSGGSLSIGPSVMLDRNADVQGLTGTTNQVCQSTILGNLSVTNNLGSVLLGSNASICVGNSFGKNVSIQGNTGSISVFDNKVAHSLSCSANSSITGGSNAAAVKEGQCAAF
jgi:hypothetical protein